MTSTPYELHPVAATLARLGELSEYLKAEFAPPSDTKWITPLDVFAPGTTLWTEAVNATARKLHTEIPNIVGSALLQSYQWFTIGCAVGSFILDRRVPDLDPDQVWVEFAKSEEATEGDETQEAVQIAFRSGRFAALPDDPAADHPDATLLPDEDALRAHLRTSLEAHFAPIIDRLHGGLGTGRRGLWLNVADRCASNFIWLMQEQNPHVGIARIQQELDRILRVPGSPLKSNKVGVFELTFEDHSQCFLERATCCYWYKSDGGDYCSTCPHRSEESRQARLLDYMAKKVADEENKVVAEG